MSAPEEPQEMKMLHDGMTPEQMIASEKRANERLGATLGQLVQFSPIYGVVYMYINKNCTRFIGGTTYLSTMAVGPVRKIDICLYFNPEFVNSLTVSQLKAVLCHEALHVLLHHIGRTKTYNWGRKLANYAQDLAINSYLPDLPEWALFPKKFGFPDHLSSEAYYKAMKKDIEDQMMKMKCAGGNGSGDSGGEPDIDDYINGKGSATDEHSLWGEMDSDDEIIAEKIRGIAKKAISAQEAKGWGNTPSGIVQEILAANKPIVNWRRELRFFVNQMIKMGRQNTRQRPNRRYGIVSPGTKKSYKAKILVGVDTSGSVGDDDLKTFIAEIFGMTQHVEVHVQFFDTQLYGKPELIDKKKHGLKPVGRGGTNFHPIIEAVDKGDYDGLIVLTDGFCDYPPKPRARVLWCVTQAGESVNIPYGKKVVIKKFARN